MKILVIDLTLQIIYIYVYIEKKLIVTNNINK